MEMPLGTAFGRMVALTRRIGIVVFEALFPMFLLGATVAPTETCLAEDEPPPRSVKSFSSVIVCHPSGDATFSETIVLEASSPENFTVNRIIPARVLAPNLSVHPVTNSLISFLVNGEHKKVEFTRASNGDTILLDPGGIRSNSGRVTYQLQYKVENLFNKDSRGFTILVPGRWKLPIGVTSILVRQSEIEHPMKMTAKISLVTKDNDTPLKSIDSVDATNSIQYSHTSPLKPGDSLQLAVAF